MGVLGIEPGFPVKAASVLHHGAFAPVLQLCFEGSSQSHEDILECLFKVLV